MNTMNRQLCGLALFISLASHAATYDEALRLKQAQQLPESEAVLISVLANEPNNTKALEQLAIVQSWQNKFDDAVSSYRRLLSVEPSHKDGRVGLARVLYWKGERRQALAELDVVLNSDADNSDLWVLRGDILLADQQANAAREAYLKAKALHGGVNDPALEAKIAAAKPPKSWRLDAGYVADDYSEVRDDEHSAYLQLAYTTSGKTTFYAKWEDYFNFNKTDRGAGIGVYWLPVDSVLLHAEWSTTLDEADFRPDDLLLLNSEFLFSAHWQPLLGIRRSTYNSPFGEGDVTTITPGIRWNIDNTSIEWRHGRTTNLDDSKTSVDTLKLTYNGDRYAPYLSYTTGEEATPPLAVAEIDVLSAGLVVRFNDAWGARVDYAREDRKDNYVHTSMGLGISAFF